MYTQISKNQEKYQTKLQRPQNINYESSYFAGCIPFMGDLIRYAASKTPSDREVILFFAESRNRDRAVCNIEIAKKKGISITTVKRATRRLEAEGFLVKSRAHEYDKNTYLFNDHARESFKEFLYWFGNLTLPQRHIFMTHGTIFESTLHKVAKLDNDPLNKYLSINLDLSKSVAYSRAHARGEKMPIEGLASLISGEKRRNVLERARFLKNISNKWGLNDTESWKLQIFPTEVLAWANEEVQSILKKGRSEALVIHDRLGFLIGICNSEWKKQGSKPNDFNFKEYCLAHNLDPYALIPPRSLTLPPSCATPPKKPSMSDNSSKSRSYNGDVVQGSVRSPGYDSPFSPYHRWVKEPDPSIEERVSKLKSCIAIGEKTIAEGKFNMFLTYEDVATNLEKDRKNLAELLLQNEGDHENQEVCYKPVANTMGQS